MAGSKTGEDQASRERGRPRGFDVDEALQALMTTFWRNGYGATSLDQLVEASGAPRASLYRVFGDKRAMFLKALDLYGRRFTERVDAALATESSGRRALAILLNASADRLVAGAAPDGCLRCNSTLELAGRDPVIDAALARSNKTFQHNLGRVVERALARGEVAPDRAAALPVFLTAIVNGLVTLARSGADRAALGLVIDEALGRFEAPSPPKGQ